MRMWFGKIPAVGDFCGSAMPQAVESELDHWISACMRDCEMLFSDQWERLYFAAPMSGFYWPPGVCKSLGSVHSIGILMPSVDKAGRAYPLIVLQILQGDVEVQPCDSSLRPWFRAVQAICAQTLEDDWPPEVLSQALLQVPAPGLRGIEQSINDTPSLKPVWFKLQDEQMDQHELNCTGLPDAVQFCRLYGYTAP